MIPPKNIFWNIISLLLAAKKKKNPKFKRIVNIC